MIPAPEVIKLAKSADSAPIFIYYARIALPVPARRGLRDSGSHPAQSARDEGWCAAVVQDAAAL